MTSLAEFLQRFPWPPKGLAPGPRLDWLWEVTLDVPVESLWPYLIDTSRLNERIGLAVMQFHEEEGKRIGRSVNLGVVQEWEEPPWEWEYCRWLKSERLFRRGWARYVRAYFLLESPAPEQTRLTFYFGWIARSWGAYWILRLGMNYIEARYRLVMQELANALRSADPAAWMRLERPEPSPVREPLQRFAQEAAPWGLAEAPFQRFCEYLEQAHPLELHRLRVKALAKVWGVEEFALLQVFLYATRQGLMMMTWDVVCPHCRAVKQQARHLGELPRQGICEVCQIDFDLTGLDGLEVTFQIHPALYPVTKKCYCSADPSHKPHILLQHTLPAGSAERLGLLLPPGVYRRRLQGRKAYGRLEILPESSSGSLLWEAHQTEAPLILGKNPTLTLQNSSLEPVQFIIERYELDQDALRPVDLFNFQDFRDLFAEESLSTQLSLDVGVQTILFTDIVGSTRFYSQQGDARAFAFVTQHFRKIYEVVREHRGAIVKTIGDAAMAAFVHPKEALLAALSLQRAFDGSRADWPLRLRISLHQGACLAVNLNSNIDYFGTTINLAAKLQSVTGPGEIVFTEAIFEAPGVEALLREAGGDWVSEPFFKPWEQTSQPIFRWGSPLSTPAPKND